MIRWLLFGGYYSVVIIRWLLFGGYYSVVTIRWLLLRGYQSVVISWWLLIGDWTAINRQLVFHNSVIFSDRSAVDMQSAANMT